MIVKTYNKLVRDKIPEIIEKSGNKAVFEKAGQQEYISFLNGKLGEELKEYLESQNIEELADMVEIIYAILDYKQVSIEEFENIRLQKTSERGAFKERLLLKEVIEG
jgi:predicted house-cleaning noncanonical NTP pyrophosphatase (MazG superfamily)